MMINKGKRCLALLICLLLVGCQKEATTEEQQIDLSDDAVTYEAENTENVENDDETYDSIMGNIQNEIMAGNFQHLEEEDSDYREYIIKHITRNIRGESYPVEWRQIDLNGDGIDDLILQDRDSVGKSSQKRIIAIFACYEDSARCITLDLQDGTEYSFCGTTGELMYTAPSYGGVISTEQYEHYYYDSEWNKIADYTLQAYRINGSESDPIPEYWIEQNPSLATNGRYYRRYEGNYTQFVNSGTEGEWKGETLTFQEFKEAYETVMGDEFYSDYFHE